MASWTHKVTKREPGLRQTTLATFHDVASADAFAQAYEGQPGDILDVESRKQLMRASGGHIVTTYQFTRRGGQVVPVRISF